MDALPGNIQLLVAAFDLKLVKSLRDAIRSADAASGKGFPVAAIGPAPTPDRDQQPPAVYEPRRRITPEPIIEPRRHITPTPVYEARPIFCACPPTQTDVVFVPVRTEGARATKLTLEPPWKSVPWKNPTPTPIETKVVVRVNDKVRSGQMIDLFI